MLQKKICMLGAFAVGKTSLVRRFVDSMFSEKYQTTVGVKIDKKTLDTDAGQIVLMLWDLHGEDSFQKVRASYLRGSAGYLLVADSTRAATLETARQLQALATETCGPVPFLLLVNKADLTEHRTIDAGQLQALKESGWQILETSALSGDNVEEAFRLLAQRMSET